MSLKAKFLLLVIVSAVFELTLIGWQWYLQEQVEEAAARSQKSKDVTQAINILSETLFGFVTTMNNTRLSADFVASRDLEEAKTTFLTQYKVLKKAFKNDPEKLAIIQESQKSADEGLAIFAKLQAGEQGQFDELKSPGGRHKYLKRLRQIGKEVLSEPIMEINREEKIIGKRSPEQEQQLREFQRSVLLIGAFLQVAVACIAAFVLTRGVSSRLSVMLDNTYRLASGLPLHEVQKGDDEIALLDQKFREMSDSLAEVTRRERATVDNARDMICSIDEQGRLITVNPASHAILGYAEDELLGRYYIDLVRSSDSNEVLASMEQIAAGEESKPFEVLMSGKEGALVDTVWTVHWSPEDKTYSCVIHDDSDRKEAERVRQEVVAMITHDLRTPLSTIRNFLEMMEHDLFGEINEKGKHMLKLADTNSARMMGLINDLLDIEKIKAGTMELQLGTVPLHPILEQATESLDGLAQAAGIKFDITKDDVVVYIDEDKVARVMTNLLYNAVKFSPRESTVSITIEQNNGRAYVNVTDQGRGIPEHMLETIFDRFTQVEASDARAKGGSGLGLAICKAIVELHGGSISVASEPGRGATFTFSLPVAS